MVTLYLTVDFFLEVETGDGGEQRAEGKPRAADEHFAGQPEEQSHHGPGNEETRGATNRAVYPDRVHRHLHRPLGGEGAH